MENMNAKRTPEHCLEYHIKEFLAGNRRFENVYEALLRMVKEKPIIEIDDCGVTKYDYAIFREGERHLIGLYDTINDVVQFIKNAKEKGESKSQAIVLVGEPGTGKTFFCMYLGKLYKNFLRRQDNRKRTFRFINLEQFGPYIKIPFLESQTFEDPMILAMNLLEDKDDNMEYLCRNFGFSDKKVDEIYKNYRFLGADSAYILEEIKRHTGGDIKKTLEFIEIAPVSTAPGTITLFSRAQAKEKITASAIDLVGEEDIQRLFRVPDLNNPARFNLRRGVLARAANGGIIFTDEFFKNRDDFINEYLAVLEENILQNSGYIWPMDSFIIATSNNEEYNKFRSKEVEGPMVNRCEISYVPHITNYKLQMQVADYALGEEKRETIMGESLHRDPNLKYAISIPFVASALPHTDKLTIAETVKLAANETIGEKSSQILAGIVEELSGHTDVTKRVGQKGLGFRNLGRVIKFLVGSFETNKGKCMFAGDVFKWIKKIILDYINEDYYRDKYQKDLEEGRKFYIKHIKTEVYNAYRNDSGAINKDVLDYINMIMAIDSGSLGPDNMWKYKDPQTGGMKALKVDEKYVNAVEEKINRLKSKEQVESFRKTILHGYWQGVSADPEYSLINNNDLVDAVTEVRINSDVGTAASLIGALTNRTIKANNEVYLKIVDVLMNKMGHCETCAIKTIEEMINNQG